MLARWDGEHVGELYQLADAGGFGLSNSAVEVPLAHNIA